MNVSIVSIFHSPTIAVYREESFFSPSLNAPSYDINLSFLHLFLWHREGALRTLQLYALVKGCDEVANSYLKSS